MNLRRKLSVLVILLTLCAALGCSHTPYVVHPGATGTPDSQMADRLNEAQASLTQAKKNIADGTWPKTWAVEVDHAGFLYNVARTSLITYEDVAAGKKTGDPVALQALATKDIQALADAVSALFSKGAH